MERIAIEPRRRGSPTDKVVSELMILANSTWGALFAENRIPAIYRVQAAGKVKMSTQPGAHEGLGVANYAWSTSPIRRYVDLVNQRQLIAVARGEAPPHPKAQDLFETLRDFELAYDAYAEFQRGMERYWCLRWIEQEGVRELTGSVIRDNLVRLERLPIVVRAQGVPTLAPGTPVSLQVGNIDYLGNDLVARFHGGLSATP